MTSSFTAQTTRPDTAGGDKAKPKKGKAVGPPLSEDPPVTFTALPEFGSIEWTSGRLPWVGEGPEQGISGMGMVAHEGRLYVCGGFIPGGDGSDDKSSYRTSRWTWRYDSATDTWERLADAPTRREYVRAIATENAVYLLGGGCQYKGQDPPYRAHGHCVRLDLDRRSPVWETHSRLNVPRTHTAVGRVGGCLVAAGGNEYDFTQQGYSHATIRDTTEVFDLERPESGWRRGAPMPPPGRGWTASVATPKRLYVFGGLTWTESNAAVATRETLCYDPAVDRWEKRTPPPLGISGWEGALYANRYAVLVGGVERRVPSSGRPLVWSDLVWVYDTQDDLWLRIDDPLPPGAVFNDPGVAVIGESLFVVGAEGPHGSHYDYFLTGRIDPH